MNHLLETESPIVFGFLINGSLLQTTLREYLSTNRVSSETILNVEYIRIFVPPTKVTSFEHEDWVSSIDVLSSSFKASSWDALSSYDGPERILSASYDGLLRIWDTSSQLLATSSSENEGGHTMPVKSTRFLSPQQVASAGMDRSIRIWNYTDDPTGKTTSLTPKLELYGHEASINALDTHYPISKILSASDDHTIGIWTSKKSSAPEVPDSVSPGSSKRQKRAVNTPQRGPLHLLKSHTAAVKAISFKPNDYTVAYSASSDHTMRTWDLTTTALVDTRTTSHPLLCLQVIPHQSLIAVGTSARHITLIDPRDSAKNISVMTLRGHLNFVSCLSLHEHNQNWLVSGSHDGTVRIWDLRSTGKAETGEVVVENPVVLYRDGGNSEQNGKLPVAGEGVKIFDVHWDKDIGIVSCGEDKRVQINSHRV